MVSTSIHFNTPAGATPGTHGFLDDIFDSIFGGVSDVIGTALGGLTQVLGAGTALIGAGSVLVGQLHALV
jgi:hypothetical protein